MLSLMNRRNVITAVLGGAMCIAAAAQAQPKANEKKPEQPAQKQADKTEAAKIGEAAPDFVLTDLEGNEHSLSDLTAEGKIVVLEWFNGECPYIIKHHSLHQTMNDLYSDYTEKGVVFIAINSNAPGKQGSGKEYNEKKAKEFKIPFPLCLDEDGAVGKAYGAKKTPHMFVINAEGTLVYGGAIDNDPSPRNLGDVNYVRKALDEVLAGQTVTEAETKAYGCSIKYQK